MTDVLPEPEDFGAPLASEAHTSYGGQLMAEWANVLDPKDSPSGAWFGRRGRELTAGGFSPGLYQEGMPADQSVELQNQAAAAVPDTSIDDAKARVKQEGLEKDLHLPDQPSIKSPVLDLMIQEAHDRRDREAAIDRGPNSFFPNALGAVTSMGVGMIDPVNAAAFSIPVLGEARTARMIAAAGNSLFARAGVKAGIGGLQGAVGTAALQPADWWLHTRDGQDYTMAQALESVVMGAGIGGLAHSLGGAVGDVRSHFRGAPLEGSPQDLLLRGLMTGTHVHSDQLAEEGVPIGDVPGIDPDEVPGITPRPAPAKSNGDIIRDLERTTGLPAVPGTAEAADNLPPVHPAEVLGDLPPAAKEDAVHAAMASVIDGTPVRAAEMLEIAADHDPRIAESLDAYHGSPHNFDRFDSEYIGAGEGAQSYGHGLYFAENEGIARSYYEALNADKTDAAISIGGKRFDPNDPTHTAALSLHNYGGNRAKAIEHQDTLAELEAKPADREVAKKAAELLRSGKQLPDVKGAGTLYKVRITADRSKFLDWDKELSKQPHIMKLLEAHPELKQSLEDMLDENLLSTDLEAYSGRELYHMLRRHASEGALPGDEGEGGHDNKEASKFLRRGDVHGIQYLDQGSRAHWSADAYVTKPDADGRYHVNGAGISESFATKEEAQAALDKAVAADKPTRNFVVFDDKHIEITHKNGEPVSIEQLRASPEAQAERAATPAIPDLVTKPKPRGRAAAHPDTLSLNEHLASKGGLRPDPDLKAIYGSDRGPFIPGFGPLIRKSGMSLDEALSSAKQHGYMFDAHDIENGSAGFGGRTSHGLTQNDLLDHLDAESRGQKLYKPTHVEKTKYDPEQEKHVIMGALETELEKSGAKVSDIDPKLLDRTVEIVHREGVSDVMDAYERAIMEDEERYNAIADARRADPATADIPGFGDGDVARPAPGDGGRDQVGDRQAGRPEQGGGRADDPQSSSHGARTAAAAADPRWRQLADVTPDYNEPDVLEESRAADLAEEPASTMAPERSLTALETAAADAEAVWRRIEPTLTEKERALVNNVLDQLKLDKDARDKIISDGVACLLGAVS